METTEYQKPTAKKDEALDELVKAVGLLPDFVIEPLKTYIKEEVTYRLAQEMDFLIHKKVEPNHRQHTIHHLVIMGLLLMLIITVLLARII